MDLGWKLLSGGALALTSLVAGKVAESGWKVLTGNSVPVDDEGQENVVAVVAFAALSAAVIAFAQHYTTRKTHSLYAARQVSDK